MKTVLSIGLRFIFVATTLFIGQSVFSQTSSSHEIVHKYIDGKLDMMSTQVGDVEIIFRRDRVEINGLSATGQEPAYLYFKNVERRDPRGLVLVGEGVETISNPGMASVIGTDRVPVKKYRSIMYDNIIGDTDLVVTIDNNEINFSLENEGEQAEMIEVAFSQEQQSSLRGGVPTMSKFGRTFSLISQNSDITSESRDRFSIRGSSDRSYRFTLSID